MSRYAVGVDVGGTKTSAGLVSDDGAVTGVQTVPTPAASGGVAVLDAVASLVREVAGARDLVGVGVGTAGVVDAGAGRIVSATQTFADWVGTDVAGGLRRRLGCERVEVRNDVDAHALGEAWCGAGAGAASVFLVAVGTGVGGALVLDGHLRTGAHHVAGELGHVPAVGAEGLRCPCGRDGHVEALASGPGIARRYAVLTSGEASGPFGASGVAGVAAVDAREVVRRACGGDGVAERVVREAAACLGRVVAGIVTVLDPDVVVVGGGVSEIGALWWRPFEDACRAELIDVLAGLRIVPAALGAEAALIGAARSVFEAAEAGRA